MDTFVRAKIELICRAGIGWDLTFSFPDAPGVILLDTSKERDWCNEKQISLSDDMAARLLGKVVLCKVAKVDASGSLITQFSKVVFVGTLFPDTYHA
jgi:hypothetical protein